MTENKVVKMPPGPGRPKRHSPFTERMVKMVAKRLNVPKWELERGINSGEIKTIKWGGHDLISVEEEKRLAALIKELGSEC